MASFDVVSFLAVIEHFVPSGSGGTGLWVARDDFEVNSFSNNDGTIDWAGSWTEIGENDGPATKDSIA